jgi:hypothetical protein
VHFRSKAAGWVTGVRFYKTKDQRGPFTGSVWTASGRRLATATFAKTSGAGWRSAKFTKPLRIKANTAYLASYHTNSGHVVARRKYFAGHVKSRGPLLADRGLRRSGMKMALPMSSVATNYFVDVQFTKSLPASTVTTAPSSTAASSVPPAGSVYGWGLTAGNTGLAGAGVDRSTLPVFSGPITAGMTISQKRLGAVDLSNVPNVTLDRVWIRSTARQALVVGPGTVIKDSDIDGSTGPQGERIGIYGNVSAGSYAIQRVQVTGMSIGAWLDGSGSGSMTGTYIHDMVSIAGAHVDGFTRRDGTGALVIGGSRIDASGPSVTGAFFLQNTWGGRIGGVVLRDSYLEGAGYLLTLENKGAGTSVGLNNVRTRPTGYGDATRTGAVTYDQWVDVNRYDATKLPAAAGTTVNRP